MQELDRFLAGIERRAFKMALVAVHNEADALDIVQDAMMKLASHYAQRPANEWKPLFFRILENRIYDFHRKERRRKNWFGWFKPANDEQKDTANDSLDSGLDTDVVANHDDMPELIIEAEQLNQNLVEVIEALPLKQQQCFLLRAWEGFSVKETADAMNISEGSVKTHYARAMHKLQQVLDEET